MEAKYCPYFIFFGDCWLLEQEGSDAMKYAGGSSAAMATSKQAAASPSPRPVETLFEQILPRLQRPAAAKLPIETGQGRAYPTQRAWRRNSYLP